MKNFNKISRRAFLSAIGVMAATSMMTACAQTPAAGKDEDITFQPQTKSLIFDDKAFVVLSGCGVSCSSTLTQPPSVSSSARVRIVVVYLVVVIFSSFR